MTQSVLFVCLGNICRSPTAEIVLRQKAKDAGLPLRIDSAGTGSWHIGSAPHGPMQKAALQKGYDMSTLRARQFRRTDYEEFDLILVMDEKNQKDVERYRPEGNNTPVRRYLDYAPDQPLRDMPDPYFNKKFDQTIDLVEQACEGLLKELRQKA